MSDDESSRKVISGKDLARQIRKAAYVRAKEHRAKDPKYLAMKEAARQQRRDLYQRVKAQRKAQGAEDKARTKVAERARKADERAAKDGELLKALGVAGGGKLRGRLLPGEPTRESETSSSAYAEPEASDPDEPLLVSLAAFATKGSSALN